MDHHEEHEHAGQGDGGKLRLIASPVVGDKAPSHIASALHGNAQGPDLETLGYREGPHHNTPEFQRVSKALQDDFYIESTTPSEPALLTSVVQHEEATYAEVFPRLTPRFAFLSRRVNLYRTFRCTLYPNKYSMTLQLLTVPLCILCILCTTIWRFQTAIYLNPDTRSKSAQLMVSFANMAVAVLRPVLRRLIDLFLRGPRVDLHFETNVVRWVLLVRKKSEREFS